PLPSSLKIWRIFSLGQRTHPCEVPDRNAAQPGACSDGACRRAIERDLRLSAGRNGGAEGKIRRARRKRRAARFCFLGEFARIEGTEARRRTDAVSPWVGVDLLSAAQLRTFTAGFDVDR